MARKLEEENHAPLMDVRPLLPVIAGPTASGKTACAVALAERIDGEVVSADSMQIYRGMDILSAKPDMAEMSGIPHHMLGFADPATKYSADTYRMQAKACIADILRRGKQPIMCGGTGLYIDAVTRPMSFSMQSDEKLHAQLLRAADEPGGKRKLHEKLSLIDPQSAARLHENDIRRVVRALEIYELTGMTQTQHNLMDQERSGDFHEILFALNWPKEALCQRIDKRIDEMIAKGLFDEVEALMQDEKCHPTAFQAIGYKEIASAVRGEISMERAVAEVRKATRLLAKRQMTWLRRDRRVIWLEAQDRNTEELADIMQQIIIEHTTILTKQGYRSKDE